MTKKASENAKRVSRSGLSEQVYQALKEDIINDRYAPDERVVIDVLARELGLSATPIREALARLAGEELVRAEPYVGYAILPKPTPDEIARLFEAREAIEGHAARLACQRFEPAALESLRALNAALGKGRYGAARYRDFAGFVTANQDFHVSFIRMAQNPPLLTAFDSLHYDSQIARASRGRGIPDIAEIFQEHEEMLDAVEARDEDRAQAAAIAHIRSGAERMLGSATPS